MKKTRLALLLIFVMLISACTRVQTDADPSVSVTTEEQASPSRMQTTQDPEVVVIEDEEPAAPKPETYKAVIDALEGQLGMLLDGETITLPDDYSVFDYAQGDIGSDGKNDVAVILEKPLIDEYELVDQIRSTYIFKQRENGYQYWLMNEGIVLSSKLGGVWGDPYNGISVSTSGITIDDFGGSSSKWSDSYVYELIDNQLILTAIHTWVLNSYLNSTSEVYDLKNGTDVIWFCFRSPDNSPDLECDSLLLYKGEITVDQPITFEDAGDGYELIQRIKGLQPWYALPNVEGYNAEDYTDYSDIMKINPCAALDKIKEKYYPDMQKEYLPLTDEMLENYSTLLGYQVPYYYYTDGVSVLRYYDFTFFEDDNRYCHEIKVQSVNIDAYSDYKNYAIWDDTGEIESEE